MRNKRTNVDNIPEDLMLEFDELQFKPTHKYDGRIPRIAVFCDDCQSTRIFNIKAFLNLCIRHRHVAPLSAGGAIGISVFLAIQNYKAVGGLPRSIKNNATALGIFKIQSTKELDDIYEGVAGEITKDQFMQAYEYAMTKEYGFLLIDFHPRKNHSMFRSQFSEMLHFDDKLSPDTPNESK
jgi:hypothetical protein